MSVAGENGLSLTLSETENRFSHNEAHIITDHPDMTEKLLKAVFVCLNTATTSNV